MRSDRFFIGVLVMTFLVAYTVIAFAFFSALEGENQLIYLALLGAPLVLSVFLMPHAALILLGALVYSIDWLAEFWELIPREATWLIDILILLLIARTILFMPGRRERMPRIEKLIFLILGFALLSALLNGGSQATTLIGLRVGFRYVLLFVAAYHLNVSRHWLRGYIVYLFIIGLIQTPVIIAQYNYMGWIDPDALCGTFGRNQTPGIAIFLLTLFCFLAARMLEDRRLHFWDLVIFGIMSISPVLGEAKFYFLFLPILILFFIRSEVLRRPAISIGLLVVGAAMIYAVDFVILSTGGWAAGRNPLTYVTKLQDVFTSEMEEPQADRFERTYKFVSAIRLALGSPRDILLGNGPGAITSSYVSETHSPKAAYFSRWGLSSSTASIPWLLIEYGYLGTALFMYVLWMIFRRGRVLRHSSDRELRIWGRMLESMTFLYFAWLWYTSAWQSDSINFIYWPLAAIFVRQSYREEQLSTALDKQQQRVDTRGLTAPRATA